jgi:hypothetical protein
MSQPLLDQVVAGAALSPLQRRLLGRRLDEARRAWAADRAEDDRLRDDLELAMHEEGTLRAARDAALGEAAVTQQEVWRAWWATNPGPDAPRPGLEPSAQAALTRFEQLGEALREATVRRGQLERELRPSPMDDDIRLGRHVPVERRLADGLQRLVALASTLGEPLTPEERDALPRPPAAGPPGEVELTMAWRHELVRLGQLPPDATAARPLPPSPPPGGWPVTNSEAGPSAVPDFGGDPGPPAPAPSEADDRSLRARLDAVRERLG